MPLQILIEKYSLSRLLTEAWQSYEKLIQKSLIQQSPKNIHRLRVSTQKLQAVLILGKIFYTGKEVKHLHYAIKKVRKKLGPLRDIQVELKDLKKLELQKNKIKISKKLKNYLLQNEKIEKTKVNQFLKEISLNNTNRSIDKIMEKLIKIEFKINSEYIQYEIGQKINITIHKFKKNKQNVNLKNSDEIHQFRIHLKKLRYLCELYNFLAGRNRIDLNNFKKIQDVTGQIHNDVVLLNTLEDFLKMNKYKHNSNIYKLKNIIKNKKNKLIFQDLKKMQELNFNITI